MRNQRKKTKEVEIDIDRKDINKADLREGKGTRRSKKKGYRENDDINEKGSKGNDPSWYSHNPQLLKDTATFAMSMPSGVPIDWNIPTVPGNVTISPYIKSVPGIAALHFVPTIGHAEGSSADPINVAANANYTFVRHAVSTYAQYDAPDLMMYLLAMDSAYSIYAMAVRAYGLMQASYVYNRYYPRAATMAAGFSYDNLITQLADFRAAINAFAYKLAQFCVPSEMDYFKRHIWMNQNCFYDSNTVKAQMYMFVMDGFYKFAEQSAGPAKLLYTKISDYANSNGLLDLDALQNIFNDAILPLMESQDCIAMSGDILRAYGADHIYTIAPIAESYLTIPVYSDEVLSQFENATLMGNPLSVTQDGVTYSPDITQRVSLDIGGVGLMQSLAFNCGSDSAGSSLIFANMLKMNCMLNFHKNDVTPDDIMVASRLTNIVNVAAQTPTDPVGYGTLKTNASEVATCIRFTYFTNAPTWTSYETAPIYCFQGMDIDSASITARNAQLWSQFDWCPKFWLYANNQDVEGLKEMFMLQDTDNYTMLTEKDLRALTDTAMLSLFASSAMATLAAQPIR